MFLVNWFWSTLNYLGLSKKSARIIFIGLDNAGKTTLLHVLRDNKLLVHEPTRHPQAEELVIGNIRFDAHDLGGHEAARRLWSYYLTGADGVIFLVDATAEDRLGEVKKELDSLMADKLFSTVPFAILGNKVDVKGALTEPQLKQALGIADQVTGKAGKAVPEGTRPLEVFMCSVVERGGYQVGFQWLANYLP